MVQIERPTGGQVAVGRPDVDSQAITEESIAPAEEPLGEPTGASGFTGSQPQQNDHVKPAASATPPDWQSERTRKSRQVALVAALSVMGLLSAAVVFGWFVRSWRGSPDSKTDVAAATADADRMSPDSEPTGSSEGTGSEATESNDAESRDVATDEEAAETTKRAEATAMDAQETRGSDDESTKPAEAIAESSQSTTEPDNAIASIPSDLMPQSPIIPAEAEESAPEPPAISELPAGMQQYIPFLPIAGSLETPTLKAPPTMDEVRIDAAAEDRDAPIVPVQVQPLNLRGDLGIDLALASDGYPLTDLVLIISQTTGVPIQIDWVSFDLAGIDVTSPIPTEKGWQTARELLDSTADAVGAEVREEPTLLILTLTDAAFAETLSKVTNLSDFGNAQASATRTLNTFLQGDPEARELQIGASREDQQRAALAVEALRRMRGIPGKVDDPRLGRWARSSAASVEWPAVAGGIAGPQMDTPISLAGFLRRMARQNQSSCVVNWYDAGRRATSPKFLILPHANKDAGTTLQQALAPLGLQARQVDPGHWWVGSEATYDRLTAIVWTEPLGEHRESFQQRIARTMQGSPPETFRIAIDEESDRSLLLLPRFIVRQLPRIAPAIAAK